MKKIAIAVVLLLLSQNAMACLCQLDIEQGYKDMDKAVNDEILAKIPSAIDKATQESKNRIEKQNLLKNQLIILVQKEKEKRLRLIKLLFDLKKEILVMQDRK